MIYDLRYAIDALTGQFKTCKKYDARRNEKPDEILAIIVASAKTARTSGSRVNRIS
jgi:hypothetical protein